MFKYLKSKLKQETPFIDEINRIKVAQARIYVGGDAYIAEDQWAQVTLSLNNSEQYAVFERRLSDRNTYHDWKLFLLMSKEDFEFIHQPYDKFDSSEGSNTIDLAKDKYSFEAQIKNRKRERKELYI
mmetsp:Transcript_5862/g.6610  ORF Transcript_5862/g.6610 Transcript_5862/m.6610 type:complete len:127 (+) Transcript_5862:36-416(+)